MLWNKSPITAASGPSPMATVKTSTHRIVGTARKKDMSALITLLSGLFDRLTAANRLNTKAITAPMNVVSTARANDTKRPVTTSASVKCPASPGCSIIMRKSSAARESAAKKETLP